MREQWTPHALFSPLLVHVCIACGSFSTTVEIKLLPVCQANLTYNLATMVAPLNETAPETETSCRRPSQGERGAGMNSR